LESGQSNMGDGGAQLGYKRVSEACLARLRKGPRLPEPRSFCHSWRASSNTQSYQQKVKVYWNLSWFVQQGRDDTAVQLSRIALVLGPGLEAGEAAALVVGVELELEADRILDAAHEAHAGVGLFVHDVFLWRLHYNIDASFGQA
jgi:hypothetical protein